MKNLIVINYGAGNLHSILGAAQEAARGRYRVALSHEAKEILAADALIFPGVGSFAYCKKSLEQSGLIPVLEEKRRQKGRILAICVGYQLLFAASQESPGVEGLGWLKGEVRKFRPASPADKIPHMGWNSVIQTQQHRVFSGIENREMFYFTHSYYCVPEDGSCILAESEYAGYRFASGVAFDNIVGLQFHPEKSHRLGLELIRNFLLC